MQTVLHLSENVNAIANVNSLREHGLLSKMHCKFNVSHYKENIYNLSSDLDINIKSKLDPPGHLIDEHIVTQFLLRCERNLDRQYFGKDAIFDAIHWAIVSPAQYKVSTMRSHLANFMKLHQDQYEVSVHWVPHN